MSSTRSSTWSIDAIYRLAYLGLGLLLFTITAYFVYRRLWIEDHWVHAAIVRELTQRPFSPTHPLLNVEHAWIPYWPYAVFVAAISRVTGLAPYAGLAAMGFVNLGLLVYAVRAFVRRFSANEAAPFFALALILLLWGPEPWLFSAFLHLEVLFHVNGHCVDRTPVPPGQAHRLQEEIFGLAMGRVEH